MAHTSKINPARLGDLLGKYPNSQKELAAKIGTDVGTLSRWKSGKVKTLRSDNLARLCEALGTTPTELCADGPLPESSKDSDAANRGQVTMMLDTACRNALALVARRYGVTRQQIVEVAPLLFLVIAEESLSHRRKQLQLHENSAPRHLREWLKAPFDPEDQELLGIEERSIEERDLFAAHVVGWDENYSKDNPFALFLSEKLSETKLRGGKVVIWDGDESPSYMIGIDELVDLIGNDKNAWRLVLKGKVALAEMPGDIRKATPEIRASWVKEKAAQNEQELHAALSEFDFESLGFEDFEKSMTEAAEQRKYDF